MQSLLEKRDILFIFLSISPYLLESKNVPNTWLRQCFILILTTNAAAVALSFVVFKLMLLRSPSVCKPFSSSEDSTFSHSFFLTHILGNVGKIASCSEASFNDLFNEPSIG